MYNLIRFIKINQFILLFLLIEGFSIYLLIANNSYQASSVIKFTAQKTGFIYEFSDSFYSYIGLKKINDHLVKENAKLYSLLKNQSSFNDSLIVETKDYLYYPAKIINNSVHKRNNFITINKGKRHGIKEGMGVITKKAVIGVIYSVSQHYSIAISLLHRKSAIGIQLKKNNHNGILKWNGFEYRSANINNFPNHIPINTGDTIVTNSHSIIFPEGIPIGKINKITKDKNRGFLNVKVDLFEDFNQTKYVYIINSNKNEEQKKLEKKIIEHE